MKKNEHRCERCIVSPAEEEERNIYETYSQVYEVSKDLSRKEASEEAHRFGQHELRWPCVWPLLIETQYDLENLIIRDPTIAGAIKGHFMMKRDEYYWLFLFQEDGQYKKKYRDRLSKLDL